MITALMVAAKMANSYHYTNSERGGENKRYER